MDHICLAPDGRVFCELCGTVVDRDGFRSINFGGLRSSANCKETVDVHDGHTVTTVESGSNRVDVHVKQLEPARLKGPVVNGF